VTVVIPVYNGTAELVACLAAVRAQDYPADRFDVLVVDNASTEDVGAAVPDDDRITLLSESRRGSYAARNKALNSARGEIIAFTDADCVPRGDWLSEGVAALTGPPVADFVGGPVELFFAHGAPGSAAELYESVHGFPQQQYVEQQGWAVTANMITWRRTFDRVGTFDAGLQSRGDAEWGQRVAQSGGLPVYAARAAVGHPARATWGELLRKRRRVTGGRIAADRAAGRGGRHFLGLAAHQLVEAKSSLAAMRGLAQLNSATARARYACALLITRLLSAGLFGIAAVRSSGRAGSPAIHS
jgi:glycosyltransferase involved in cell wall biosynthesis